MDLHILKKRLQNHFTDGLVTIIGWLTLLCGIMRLFFHKECMKYMAKTATNRSFFVFWGIFMLIVGGFLVAKSFFGQAFFY